MGTGDIDNRIQCSVCNRKVHRLLDGMCDSCKTYDDEMIRMCYVTPIIRPIESEQEI